LSDRPAPDDDAAWAHWRDQWRFPDGVTYLNHGSFGPPPLAVRQARRAWIERLDNQPMDFFVRQFEPAWFAARQRLAQLVGTDEANLVPVDNATAGMNVVAAAFSLTPGDEVVLTDHEYGAVRRIWQRACARARTDEPKIATLPERFTSAEQVVEAILSSFTPATRLLVVSHITSPTAIILPLPEICRAARERGVAVCVDGPHAVAQIDLNIDSLDCDYYTASCHKWLSAPFGSGFLYVHPRRQEAVSPLVLSWGRLSPTEPRRWDDEFVWSGTRDPSAFLAVPTAIEFLEDVDFEAFRARTHALARYARESIAGLVGLEPLVPDSPEWYGSMAHVPLPPKRAEELDARQLQNALWRNFGIEVPIVEHNGRRAIRVSCHLYNNRRDIDRLVNALGKLLA